MPLQYFSALLMQLNLAKPVFIVLYDCQLGDLITCFSSTSSAVSIINSSWYTDCQQANASVSRTKLHLLHLSKMVQIHAFRNAIIIEQKQINCFKFQPQV
jgi:hypothetical protein